MNHAVARASSGFFNSLLVAEGLDNRMIAARLGKGEKTVRNQVSIIFDKLGVKSRAQAIVTALAE